MNKIILRTEQHRQRAIDIISAVKLAPVMEVIVQKHRDKKTLQQLGYCFGVIYPAIAQFISDSYGDSFSVDEIHVWMKKQILGVDHKEIEGEVIEIERELKKSDKDAWSAYIDKVITFCWQRWGLQVPAPIYREDK